MHSSGGGLDAHASEKVSIASPSWTGAKAIAHVLKEIIERPLNTQAELIDGLTDYPTIFKLIGRGDGSVDVHPDLWMPSGQAVWDEYIDGVGSVATNRRPYTGTEQIFVPHYVAKVARSMRDLKSARVAENV